MSVPDPRPDPPGAPGLPGASVFESARPEADLEGRLILEAMRGSMFGKREKPLSVGRYELIERLGSGALGLVVAARDPELDRRVAIKLLPARVDSRKLLREARALARLSSPHVVPILDVGTFEPSDIGTLFGGDPGDPAGQGVWLAMELVNGTPLDQWIKQGPHDWREVLKVFMEAGKGLADAHGARIVHRDFKPANVIRGDDGRVRVVDFGLARSPNLSFMTSADAVAAADDAALLRGLIGTPAYMSPEQHKGEPTDERADQFSFCVSLYEALYGELPYPGPRYEDFMRDKNKGPPPMPSQPAVPLEIRRALTRGLDTDPALRFPSMTALLAALRQGMVEQPPSRRGLWIAGAAFVLAGGIAVWIALKPPAQCAVPPASEGWDGMRQDAVAAVSKVDVPYAKVAAFRVQEVLDARIGAWNVQHDALCSAGRVPEGKADCLEWARGSIQAVLSKLQVLDATRVANVDAILRLADDAARCGEVDAPAVDGAAQLHEEITAARIDTAFGGSPELDPGELQTRAEALGVEALRAEASLAVAESRPVGEATVTLLQSTYDTATEAGRPDLAAQAVVLAIRAGERGDWIARAKELGGQLDGHLAIAVGLAYASALEGDAALAALDALRGVVEAESSASAGDEAAVYGALADALSAAGRADEARARAEKALSVAESGFGPGHPRLVEALERLGRLELTAGKPAEAEHRLRSALEILDRREHDGVDPDRGRVLVALAEALSVEGRHDEAGRHLERAVKELPGDVVALTSYCRVLLVQGALAEAEARCSDGLAAQEKLDASDDAAMLALESLLARVLIESGQLAAAEERLDGALARAEKRFGPDHPESAPLLIAKADLRQRQSKDVEAIALLDRVAALSSTLGAADSRVVTAVVRRAWLMSEGGKAGAALTAVRDHLADAGDELSASDRFELRFAEAVAQWNTGAHEEGVMAARRARQAYARTDAARADLLARADAWLSSRN